MELAGQVSVWARYGAVVYLRGEIAFGISTACQIGAANGGYVEL